MRCVDALCLLEIFAKTTSFFCVYFRFLGISLALNITSIDIATSTHSFILENRFQNLNSLLSSAQLPLQLDLPPQVATDIPTGDTIGTANIEH